MKTYRSSLDDRLKDQNFRSEYENIQPEIEIIRTLVRARKEQNLRKRSFPRFQESIKLILASLKMEIETLHSECSKDLHVPLE